ncbi:DEAD/DEAH box ATP-dependent RNA helicase, putative [Hepatocystis sp. ex Piliocolobus tephrosceles]|nr:DEAD/DEAH box ATP-dependent RNA helicase, putative [Hepatocystis sp. ex Piliocolobus tephrosceles]
MRKAKISGKKKSNKMTKKDNDGNKKSNHIVIKGNKISKKNNNSYTKNKHILNKNILNKRNKILIKSKVVDKKGKSYNNNSSNKDDISKTEKKTKQTYNSVVDKDTLWSDLHLSRPFLKVLYELEFNNPTYIQKDVIPLALEGKSILATSETGSGKTLAFVLPILERLLHTANIKVRSKNEKSLNLTKALILLPTRELAFQCYEVVKSLTKYVCITSSLFCGGIDTTEQELEYKKQKDIFICTPGRILDLLLNGSNDNVNFLEVVVFDEADKLLELGFKKECLKVLDMCKYKKQILFFSATLTKDIKDLANCFLTEPLFIQSHKPNTLFNVDNNENIKNCNSTNNISTIYDESNNNNTNKKQNKLTIKTFAIAENLQQEFIYLLKESHRKSALLYLCSTYFKSNCIIFFKTRKETHMMFLLFNLLKLKCVELHGSLTQSKRIESIIQFKNEEVDFLLCTELASRGIDIDHIRYVINYNLPSNTIKYVHRIGRTARIGKNGIACTLYLAKEKKDVKKIIKGIKKNNKSIISKKNIDTDHISYWDNIIKKNRTKFKEILKEEIEQKKQNKISKSMITDDKIKHMIILKNKMLSNVKSESFEPLLKKNNLSKTGKENIKWNQINLKINHNSKIIDSIKKNVDLGTKESSKNNRSHGKNINQIITNHISEKVQNKKRNNQNDAHIDTYIQEALCEKKQQQEFRDKEKYNKKFIYDLKLNIEKKKIKPSIKGLPNNEKWTQKGIDKNSVNKTRFIKK